MLAKNKGVHVWRVYDTPAMSVVSNKAGYGAYPPEQEIVVSQTDWRGGMGHEYQDGKPVYKGTTATIYIAIDTRWKGKLMLGPQGNVAGVGTGHDNMNGTGVKFVEFTDNLWVAAGTYVYKLHSSNAYWTTGTDLTSSITDL